MARDIRSDPTRSRFPALRGVVIVDTCRGRLRVRGWHRKRGKAKSARQQATQDWFQSLCRLMKFAPPNQVKAAMKAAKGTGLYPRDLLMRAASRGLVEPVLPDGTVIRQRRYFMETLVFNGAALSLTANQTTGNTTLVAITWPLPDIDTAGFWDAGAPTRLTIPNGVEIVAIRANISGNVAVANNSGLTIQKNGATFIAVQNQGGSPRPDQGLATPPLNVVAGDYFEILAYINTNNTLRALGYTNATLEVLQADANLFP